MVESYKETERLQHVILTSRFRSSASRWSRSFSSCTRRSVNIRRRSDNVFWCTI